MAGALVILTEDQFEMLVAAQLTTALAVCVANHGEEEGPTKMVAHLNSLYKKVVQDDEMWEGHYQALKKQQSGGGPVPGAELAALVPVLQGLIEKLGGGTPFGPEGLSV